MKRTSKILKGVTWNKTEPRRKHNKHESWVVVERGPGCAWTWTQLWPSFACRFWPGGRSHGYDLPPRQDFRDQLWGGVRFCGWSRVSLRRCFFLLRTSHELESSPPRFWLAIESGLISPFWTNSNHIVGHSHSHIPCPHEMVHFIPHVFRCRPCDGRHWQCRHWSHGLGPRPRGHLATAWWADRSGSKALKTCFHLWTCQKIPKYLHTRFHIVVYIYALLELQRQPLLSNPACFMDYAVRLHPPGSILLWFAVSETVHAQWMYSHCHFTLANDELSIHLYIRTSCPTYLIAILVAC